MKYIGTYEADGGSILLTPREQRENPSEGVTLPNGFGDGEFDIYLADSTADLPEGVRFVTMLYGDWDIRGYDCELNSPVIATIESKRFAVSNYEGEIYITIWDKKEEDK